MPRRYPCTRARCPGERNRGEFLCAGHFSALSGPLRVQIATARGLPQDALRERAHAELDAHDHRAEVHRRNIARLTGEADYLEAAE